MSLNSYNAGALNDIGEQTSCRRSAPDNPLVLLVKDQEDTLLEIKEVLELSGYRVIDTDNGWMRPSEHGMHVLTSSSSILKRLCSISWLPRARS